MGVFVGTQVAGDAIEAGAWPASGPINEAARLLALSVLRPRVISPFLVASGPRPWPLTRRTANSRLQDHVHVHSLDSRKRANPISRRRMSIGREEQRDHHMSSVYYTLKLPRQRYLEPNGPILVQRSAPTLCVRACILLRTGW